MTSGSSDTAFPRSRAVLAAVDADLVVRDRTGSTNADLLAVAAETAHGSAIVTMNQTAGRGRLDRSWVAPEGQALAASVLVRIASDPVAFGWLPLAGGVAMRDAVAAHLPGHDVTVKWPNDVLVDGRKVSGILAQVASDGSVVVGAGVNLTIPPDALPTPVSTSIAASAGTEAAATADARTLGDAVFHDFWVVLIDSVRAITEGGARWQRLRERIRAACGTVGRLVRVELPDGGFLTGTATGIDDGGRITIVQHDGVVTAVSVGDVTHLRYA